MKIDLKVNRSDDDSRRQWALSTASNRDERVPIVGAVGGLLIMQIQFNNQFRLNFDCNRAFQFPCLSSMSPDCPILIHVCLLFPRCIRTNVLSLGRTFT